MSSRLKRILIGVVIVVLVLSAVGTVWYPRQVAAGLPQIDGEIQLAGLDGPVDVYRDAYGIPHIYASTEHDLFMAQGYVHAQDRFWQMDFQRHTSAGRLSELLGSTTLETDMFLRTLGWERVAKQELAQTDPQILAMLQAYADGVNVYLDTHHGTELGLEYAFLGLLNRGYQPEPWEPLHTLTWAKAMAWDLKGNMEEEITRAVLLATLSEEQIDELYPPYPADRPYIVNDHAGFSTETQTTPEAAALSRFAAPGLAQAAELFTRANAVLGGAPSEHAGSNSWAISGELTDTGMPLLANDPHLSAALPHIWYQVGLHCAPKTEDCPIDVAGFSFPGTPLVVIGHNDRIAWGFTNVGPDVMDLYIEKINPENPLQYEVDGEWVDMEVITESIRVGQDEIQEIEVRMTRHGPVISDVYGALEDFSETAGIELPENYAIALRWTALEPNFTYQAVWNFSRAENFEEFREAAKDFAVPAQNLLYADVDGNIGYQMPGRIPIRNGYDGRYPVPGWTDETEWQGYILFEELPFAYNPDEGYIVTANNAVVDSSYPYLISSEWAYGYRAQRITDLIEAAPGPIDAAYIQAMQGDNYSLNAEEVLPVLMALDLDDEDLAAVRAVLQGWDYQEHMDSIPAALYEVFWKHLLLKTFADDLPEDEVPGGSGRWFAVIRNILGEPDNPWWDDAATEAVEGRDEVFRAAFAAAVDEIKAELGADPEQWAWGDLHQLYLEHGVMTNFPLINKAFNRGPFPVSGGASIVNNTVWGTDEENYWISGVSPSMRMIVDLSDPSNSLVIHPTGQSGHPGSPHYLDMIDLWREIEYIPMHFDLAGVQAAAEGHLRLVP